MKFYYNILSALDAGANRFFVSYKRVIFPFFVDFKGLEKWVIFFPAAIRRDAPPPVFLRSQFSPFVDANVISLFDPNLLLYKNLTNSWYSGDRSRNHAKLLAIILKDFFLKRKVSPENILLFGTSAGGIPAGVVAKELPGSKVCLGNVQVEALKHAAFKKMVPLLYPGLVEAEVFEAYRERFDLKLSLNGGFDTFFFQNKSDVHHYKNHFSPLVDWVADQKEERRVNFYLYDDPAVGHGSVGKVKEINLINNILNYGEPREPWAIKL